MGIVPITLENALIDIGVLLFAAVALFVIAWKKAQWRES
jgi:hypothetical protein